MLNTPREDMINQQDARHLHCSASAWSSSGDTHSFKQLPSLDRRGGSAVPSSGMTYCPPSPPASSDDETSRMPAAHTPNLIRSPITGRLVPPRPCSTDDMGKQAIERLHNVPDIMVRALDLEWELSVTLKKLDSWKAKEVERLIKENGVNTQTHRKSNSVIDMDTHKKDVMQEALDWMKEDLDLLKADHEDLRNAREEDLIFFEDEISKLTRRYRRRVGEAVELERKLNTIIAGKHGLVKDDARKISEMQDTNELTSMDTMEMRLELVRRNKVLTQLNEVLTRRFNEVLTQRRNELAGTKPADQGIFEHPQEPSGKNPESTVVEEESDQLHTDHVAMTMESPTFLEPQPNWKNVCDGNEELGNKGPGPDSDEPADDEPADDEPDSDEPDSDEPDSDDQDSDYQGNDNHKTRASIIGPWTARTRSAARMHNKERRENKRLTRAGKSKQSIQASN